MNEKIFEKFEELKNLKRYHETQLEQIEANYAETRNLIYHFSEFDAEEIADAIASVVTKMSGRKFVRQETRVTCQRMINHGSFAGEYEMSSERQLLVVDEKYCNGFFGSTGMDPIPNLAEEEIVIRLSKGTPRKIRFYDTTSKPFGFTVNLYGKFDYVEKFIEALVQYRCSHLDYEIKDMDSFIDNFVAGQQQAAQGSRLSLTNEVKGE